MLVFFIQEQTTDATEVFIKVHFEKSRYKVFTTSLNHKFKKERCSENTLEI